MKLLNGEFWWLRRWLLWIWVTLCVTNYCFTLLQSKHVNSFCLFCPFWHIHKEIVTWLLYNTLPLYLEAHFGEKGAIYIRSFTVYIMSFYTMLGCARKMWLLFVLQASGLNACIAQCLHSLLLPQCRVNTHAKLTVCLAIRWTMHAHVASEWFTDDSEPFTGNSLEGQ